MVKYIHFSCQYGCKDKHLVRELLHNVIGVPCTGICPIYCCSIKILLAVVARLTWFIRKHVLSSCLPTCVLITYRCRLVCWDHQRVKENTAMFQGNELSSTKCNVDQLQLSFEDNVDMFWLRKMKILVVNETYHKGSDFEAIAFAGQRSRKCDVVGNDRGIMRG